MNDKIYKQIGEELRRITHTDHRDGFPIMSGKVTSVDEGEGSCIVQLSVDDEENPTEDVTLGAVSGNSNGMILVPAINSQVLVAEVDGPGKWSLVKCSTLVKAIITVGGSKITVTDGLIQMNDGSKGGLPVATNVANKTNTAINSINSLRTAINGWVPASGDGGAALKAALTAWLTETLATVNANDLENTAFTHG